MATERELNCAAGLVVDRERTVPKQTLAVA